MDIAERAGWVEGSEVMAMMSGGPADGRTQMVRVVRCRGCGGLHPVHSCIQQYEFETPTGIVVSRETTYVLLSYNFHTLTATYVHEPMWLAQREGIDEGSGARLH